jgi:hypothetical protein
MKTLYLRMCVLALLTTCALASASFAASTNSVAPVRLVINCEKGKPDFALNSKQVRQPDLVDALSEIILKDGREKPVLVVFHEKNSFAILANIRGIVSKVGFVTVRYFCYDDHGRMMEEITFDHPAIPFSLNPKL